MFGVVVLCSLLFQSSCAVFLCSRHVQLSCAVVLCSRLVQSSCAVVLCIFSAQSSFAVVLCSRLAQSFFAVILYNRQVQLFFTVIMWHSYIMFSVGMEHQWVEGNLAHNSHCAVCMKKCGSFTKLVDQRCLWCKTKVGIQCRTAIWHNRWRFLAEMRFIWKENCFF